MEALTEVYLTQARGGSLNTYAVDAADGTTPVKLVQGAGGRNAYVNLYDTSTFRPVTPPKAMFVPPPSCDFAQKCASQFPCVRPAAAPAARVEAVLLASRRELRPLD